MDKNKQEGAKEFSRRILATVKSGYVLPVLALGSQLGLFDKMAEFKEPKTSQEIADCLHYKERYVREWLKSMVVADIVEYDDKTQTYFFPPHHHGCLVSSAGQRDFALLALGSTVTTLVHEDIVHCFKADGPRGIPYDKYVGMRDWMDKSAVTFADEKFIIGLLKQQPELLDKLEAGIEVCDVGCNTGNHVTQMAKLFPNSTFLGVDIDEETIKQNNTRAKNEGLRNVSYEVQDICNIPAQWCQKWDLITAFDVVHDLPYASKTLEKMHNSLKPDGFFLMMDPFAYSNPNHNRRLPNATVIHTMSLYHCMPVSLYHEGGEGLGSVWGIEMAEAMLAQVGFASIKRLKGYPIYMYFLCRKNKLSQL